MIIFRKYISYILVFSFMAISAMDHTFSASAESNIPICTNEGVKYLLADGSLSDSKNNKIYHILNLKCKQFLFVLTSFSNGNTLKPYCCLLNLFLYCC